MIIYKGNRKQGDAIGGKTGEFTETEVEEYIQEYYPPGVYYVTWHEPGAKTPRKKTIPVGLNKQNAHAGLSAVPSINNFLPPNSQNHGSNDQAAMISLLKELYLGELKQIKLELQRLREAIEGAEEEGTASPGGFDGLEGLIMQHLPTLMQNMSNGNATNEQ